MPSTLLLRLPSPGQEETEWLTIYDTGLSDTIRQRGSLTLAAAVSRTGKVVALADPGAVANLLACAPQSCHIHGEQVDGWIARDRIWGVGPNEVFSK